MKYDSPEPVQKTYGPFKGSAMKSLTIKPKEPFTVMVHTALYEYVKLRVTQKVQCMSVYDYFDLQEFVGADFWATLDDREKHLVGMCIGYLVHKGEVPLYDLGFELMPQKSYYIDSGMKAKTKQKPAAAHHEDVQPRLNESMYYEYNNSTESVYSSRFI